MSKEIIIQMYGLPAADADGVASIDVPEDGEIMGVNISMQAPAMTAAKGMQVEISFLSSSQFLTNDARGLIAQCTLGSGTVSTNGGFGAHSHNDIQFQKGLEVAAGERIHLHFETTDNVNCKIRAYLVFRFKGGSRARRR